jgi:hypothetical protein
MTIHNFPTFMMEIDFFRKLIEYNGLKVCFEESSLNTNENMQIISVLLYVIVQNIENE